MSLNLPFARSVVLASILGFLTACSGGGGGGTTPATAPAAPTLALNPTAVKAFRFTWTDVSGETEYRLLEDVTGSAGYTQIATPSADATSHDLIVPLPKRVNARYILQACNAQGCADSAPVAVSGALVAAIGYVKASNTGAGDSFGSSVALSGDGNTLAVGARGEGSNATSINGDQLNDGVANAGAVYVFTRSSNGATWAQQAYVKASNTGADDAFGASVALSSDGNTLAVGAHGEDSSTAGINGDQVNDAAPNAGAVYVFTRSGTTWGQEAYVKAANAAPGQFFGRSVALSGDGNTLAVGAFGEASGTVGVNSNPDGAAANAGAAYVFVRTGTAWAQQAYVKASNTGANDYFGTSVALAADGNTLAVGAYGEDGSAAQINGPSDDTATDAGAVYVFTRSGTDWAQQAYVKASNTGGGDYFGRSVALSGNGNTLAVGAHGEASNATGIDGDQSINTATGAGAVYVFARSGIAWGQEAYIKASNTGAGDAFGASVALAGDGNTLAVGAYFEDSNATGLNGDQLNDGAPSAGAVYVYTRGSSGTTWEQQAYVKASNTGAGDYFGFGASVSPGASLALAGDGNTLAVGAYGEGGSTTGLNGDQVNDGAPSAGAVYLF